MIMLKTSAVFAFYVHMAMLGSARALVWNVGPIFLEDQSWSLKKTKDVYIQIQIV